MGIVLIIGFIINLIIIAWRLYKIEDKNTELEEQNKQLIFDINVLTYRVEALEIKK